MIYNYINNYHILILINHNSNITFIDIWDDIMPGHVRLLHNASKL